VETLVRDDLHGRLTFSPAASGTHVIVRVPHTALGDQEAE
jgi:hypothetical protein